MIPNAQEAKHKLSMLHASISQCNGVVFVKDLLQYKGYFSWLIEKTQTQVVVPRLKTSILNQLFQIIFEQRYY